MDRLDTYEEMPAGFREYFSNYGRHFSKALAEYAVSKMKSKNATTVSVDDFKHIIKNEKFNIDVTETYDAYFLYNMYLTDFYPEVMKDNCTLCKAVKSILKDEDGYEGLPLTRFTADCIAKGTPIFWEEML